MIGNSEDVHLTVSFANLYTKSRPQSFGFFKKSPSDNDSLCYFSANQALCFSGQRKLRGLNKFSIRIQYFVKKTFIPPNNGLRNVIIMDFR